jgi:hypothetical protein
VAQRETYSSAEPDPEVVAMVRAIRDRFGLHGLRDAAALIDAEIVRFQADIEGAFADDT